MIKNNVIFLLVLALVLVSCEKQYILNAEICFTFKEPNNIYPSRICERIQSFNDIKKYSVYDELEIKIWDSEIKDLKQLTVLNKIYKLVIIDNKNGIDLSYINKFTELENLEIINTDIVKTVMFNNNIKSIILCNNKLKDVSFLSNTKKTKELVLGNNDIVDLNFLKQFKLIEHLDIQNTKVNDFSFLSNLKTLNTLDVKYTSFENFELLKDLNLLHYISISHIKDINLLFDLKQLITFGLSKNIVTDEIKVSVKKQKKDLYYFDDKSFIYNYCDIREYDLLYQQKKYNK